MGARLELADLAGALLLFAACQASGPESSPPAPEGSLAHGEVLYRMHCAVCHGDTGRADGAAARFLFPPARDFGLGRFRLVSSQNGAPFDDDLVATLRRGVPGSAMPAWSWIPEKDLESIAGYVRVLAEQGVQSDLAAAAQRLGEGVEEPELARAALVRLAPDRGQEAPLELAADADALKRGKALFREHCADCHGPEGRGQPEPRFDEDGTLNWARDLAEGFLKGGRSPFELACRVRTGMPGSAMPPTRLAPGDEAALLAYLRELIPDGASERLLHHRRTLHARRVPSLPAGPDDGAWSQAEEIEVVLAPLWWSADAVLSTRVAALHDGRDLAVRLAWPDATGVVQLFAESTRTDGAALQLSAARAPALFGMGAAGEPTNLWHWQALRLEDVAGAADLFDPTPHLGNTPWPEDVRSDAPRYQRFLGRPSPSATAERITVEGVPTIAEARRVQGEVRAAAQWTKGTWSVVFTRAMESQSSEVVPLRPGTHVQLACAVWNGAAGDGGARKSISIWQELELEP